MKERKRNENESNEKKDLNDLGRTVKLAQKKKKTKQKHL